jgi:hypothetical protein
MRRFLIFLTVSLCVFPYSACRPTNTTNTPTGGAANNQITSTSPSPTVDLSGVRENRNTVREEIPCPHQTDEFIAQPGEIIGASQPSNGTYVRLFFKATNDAPQRAIVKQGNRVVGRFFGDLNAPPQEAFFDSDGSDVKYEFQQCSETTSGEKQWFAYTNTFEDQSSGANKKYMMRATGLSQFTLEFGPTIVRPPPPFYVHVDGKVKCGGILGANLVATSYGFAWVTSTPDRNGPKVRVNNLKVTLHIPCRGFSKENSVQNVSEAVQGEQFRGIGVPICCDIRVDAVATLDGQTKTASGTFQPD